MSRRISSAIAKAGARVLSSRRVMRAPVLFYRARLGFLFGSRLLMLEHTGRKSGTARYVVLEVFDHPTRDTYVVVSGFGARAQWFRNVRVTPEVRVWIAGNAPERATARLLSTDEADRSMHEYAHRHPRAWARFKPVVEETLGSFISERDTELPMIALRLDGAGRRE